MNGQNNNGFFLCTDLEHASGSYVNGFGLSVCHSARAVLAKSGLSTKGHDFERSLSLFPDLSFKTKPRSVFSDGARQNPSKIRGLHATAFYKHFPYSQEQNMPYPKASKYEKERSGRQELLQVTCACILDWVLRGHLSSSSFSFFLS